MLKQESRFHPERKWRFDFAHWGSGVAIEIEGGLWTRGAHSHPIGITRDIEKYNEAALLGWTVIRLHRGNINEETLTRVIELIRKKNDQRSQNNDARPEPGKECDKPGTVQECPGKGRIRGVLEVDEQTSKTARVGQGRQAEEDTDQSGL